MSSFWVEVCIDICISHPVTPGSCIFVINIERNCLSVAFKSFPGDLTPWSIMISCACANMDSKYNAVAHMY